MVFCLGVGTAWPMSRARKESGSNKHEAWRVWSGKRSAKSCQEAKFVGTGPPDTRASTEQTQCRYQDSFRITSNIDGSELANSSD